MSSLATCPSCGYANPRTWRACARCGASLAEPKREVTDVTLLEGPDGMPAPPSSLGALAIEPDSTERTLVEDGGEGETPFIGQHAASEVIQAGIERAFTLGVPTLVSLEGDRGSGKTRMLVHASELAARMEPDALVLYAACRGEGGYAPFSRLLLDRFGVTPSSGPSAVRGQMATAVGDALGIHDAITVAETTHLLGHIAGVPFPQSPFLEPLKDQPEELRRRARKALRRLVEGDARKRPVLVLLDHMHEADPDAWDLLEALLCAEAHLAVVVAGAPNVNELATDVGERLAATQGERFGGLQTASIAPFREEDVASMLLVLVPSLTNAPEPLVAGLTHRSQGNPSAVRELIFGLAEAGAFRPASDGSAEIDLRKLEGGSLPVTMSDAIRARLMRLDAFERATLDRAAIVGEAFWAGAVLAQMRGEASGNHDLSRPEKLWPADEDAQRLVQSLERLVDKGFVERSAQSELPGTEEFLFVHAGTRALLYDAQDEEARVRRHGLVARFLTMRGELVPGGVSAMMAPHLERAGQKIRAGRAYLEAALAERAQMRNAAALRLIERALPLIEVDDVSRRLDALHEHGSLLTTLGRYDEAHASFAEMLRLAWQVGAPNKGGAALNRLARLERQRGREQQARALLERALVLFRGAGDVRGVASTLDDLAQVMRLSGENEPALAAAKEALQIRQAHDDKRGEAVSLSTIGAIELARGNLPVAESCLQKALEIRRAISDIEGQVQSLNALGVFASVRGDGEGAVRAWRDALSGAREIGDVRSQAMLLSNMAELLLTTGDLVAAEPALREASELAEQLGDARVVAEVTRHAGTLAMKRNDDDAEERLVVALEAAKAYGGREAIALAHRALGQLRSRTVFDETGQADRRAEESYLVAVDGFREIGNEKEAARALADLGLHLVERGDLDSARERLGEARAIFRRIGLDADAEHAEQTLARLS